MPHKMAGDAGGLTGKGRIGERGKSVTAIISSASMSRTRKSRSRLLLISGSKHVWSFMTFSSRSRRTASNSRCIGLGQASTAVFCHVKHRERYTAFAVRFLTFGETYSRIELQCFSEEIRMESTISTKNLKSKVDQKQVTVVETLAPERYREAHIPGAVNIPPERIKELAPQLLPNKDAEIITYCANTH